MLEEGEKMIRCWELKDCSKYVYTKCPVFINRDSGISCWETEGTRCDEMLDTPKTCEFCLVYIEHANVFRFN